TAAAAQGPGHALPHRAAGRAPRCGRGGSATAVVSQHSATRLPLRAPSPRPRVGLATNAQGGVLHAEAVEADRAVVAGDGVAVRAGAVERVVATTNRGAA